MVFFFPGGWVISCQIQQQKTPGRCFLRQGVHFHPLRGLFFLLKRRRVFAQGSRALSSSSSSGLSAPAPAQGSQLQLQLRALSSSSGKKFFLLNFRRKSERGPAGATTLKSRGDNSQKSGVATPWSGENEPPGGKNNFLEVCFLEFSREITTPLGTKTPCENKTFQNKKSKNEKKNKQTNKEKL